MELGNLYQAQRIASDVVNPPIFPCYSEKYLESKEGVHYAALQVYSTVYTCVSLVGEALSALIALVKFVAVSIFELFEPILKPLLDTVFPINHVSGCRRFVCIPRTWELSLGKTLYDGMTGNYVEVGATYGDHMEETVSKVFHQIERSNPDILNPHVEKDKFEYHVKTVHQSQVNAFAMMGGGMVVFSELVKEVQKAINENKFQETTIEFPDGSTATVDLSGLTVDDVLAGLMGHEMTHVASRHSIISIIGGLFRQAVLFIAAFFLNHQLKANDQEYQVLVNKPANQRSRQEERLLEEKEEEFERASQVLEMVATKLNALLGLNYSRAHEYEADITGLYMSEKAGYNPLGAIYLQEVLGQSHDAETLDSIHRNFEWLFTHPHSSNRKRALFAGLQELSPDVLEGRVVWAAPKEDRYDTGKGANAAMRYAKEQMDPAVATT